MKNGHIDSFQPIRAIPFVFSTNSFFAGGFSTLRCPGGTGWNGRFNPAGPRPRKSGCAPVGSAADLDRRGPRRRLQKHQKSWERTQRSIANTGDNRNSALKTNSFLRRSSGNRRGTRRHFDDCRGMACRPLAKPRRGDLTQPRPTAWVDGRLANPSPEGAINRTRNMRAPSGLGTGIHIMLHAHPGRWPGLR